MLDHLSPSQVSAFLHCGQSWVFRYVEGVKTPMSGPLVRGRALDDAATLHYRGKARGHGLEPEEFVAAALASHDSLVGNEDVALEGTCEESAAIVRRAATGYYERIARKLTPRSAEDVQRRYTANLDGLKVVGIVDLVTNTKQVVDTKLKARLPSQRDLDRDFQLATYAWLTGLRSLALAVAQPTGQATLLWTERDEQDVAQVQLVYQRVALCIGLGVAVPAAPDSWLCCPAYCGFWARCPFGEAGRVGVRAEPGEQGAMRSLADLF